MTHLIGAACGVIATLAAICLAYGITAWGFGDCPGWECGE